MRYALVGPLAAHQSQCDGGLPAAAIAAHSDGDLLRVVHALGSLEVAARSPRGMLLRRREVSLAPRAAKTIKSFYPLSRQGLVPQDGGWGAGSSLTGSTESKTFRNRTDAGFAEDACGDHTYK